MNHAASILDLDGIGGSCSNMPEYARVIFPMNVFICWENSTQVGCLRSNTYWQKRSKGVEITQETWLPWYFHIYIYIRSYRYTYHNIHITPHNLSTNGSLRYIFLTQGNWHLGKLWQLHLSDATPLCHETTEGLRHGIGAAPACGTWGSCGTEGWLRVPVWGGCN